MDYEVQERGVEDQNVLPTHPDLAATYQASNIALDVPALVVVEILGNQLKHNQALWTLRPSGNGSEMGGFVDPQPTMGPADLAKADGSTGFKTKTKYQV